MLKILTGFANGVRLQQLIKKRDATRRSREKLIAKQAEAVIADNEKLVLELREQLRTLEETSGELDRAIVEIQCRMDSERGADIDRRREVHANSATNFGIAKRMSAVAVDDALIVLEGAVTAYRTATLDEARAGRMAGTISGNVQPVIRLNHRLRAALWKWCPMLCKEANIGRLTASRWQSIADSHQNEISTTDTEKSA